jgi:hypothetical protein
LNAAENEVPNPNGQEIAQTEGQLFREVAAMKPEGIPARSFFRRVFRRPLTLDKKHWTNPLRGKSNHAALRFVRAIANRAVFVASWQPANGAQRHCRKTNHGQRDSIRFNAHKAIPLPNLLAQSSTFLAHLRGGQHSRSTPHNSAPRR